MYQIMQHTARLMFTAFLLVGTLFHLSGCSSSTTPSATADSGTTSSGTGSSGSSGGSSSATSHLTVSASLPNHTNASISHNTSLSLAALSVVSSGKSAVVAGEVTCTLTSLDGKTELGTCVAQNGGSCDMVVDLVNLAVSTRLKATDGLTTYNSLFSLTPAQTAQLKLGKAVAPSLIDHKADAVYSMAQLAAKGVAGTTDLSEANTQVDFGCVGDALLTLMNKSSELTKNEKGDMGAILDEFVDYYAKLAENVGSPSDLLAASLIGDGVSSDTITSAVGEKAGDYAFADVALSISKMVNLVTNSYCRIDAATGESLWGTMEKAAGESFSPMAFVAAVQYLTPDALGGIRSTDFQSYAKAMLTMGDSFYRGIENHPEMGHGMAALFEQGAWGDIKGDGGEGLLGMWTSTIPGVKIDADGNFTFADENFKDWNPGTGAEVAYLSYRDMVSHAEFGTNYDWNYQNIFSDWRDVLSDPDIQASVYSYGDDALKNYMNVYVNSRGSGANFYPSEFNGLGLHAPNESCTSDAQCNPPAAVCDDLTHACTAIDPTLGQECEVGNPKKACGTTTYCPGAIVGAKAHCVIAAGLPAGMFVYTKEGGSQKFGTTDFKLAAGGQGWMGCTGSEADVLCEGGLACDIPLGSKIGTCVPSGFEHGDGAPCYHDEECKSGSCSTITNTCGFSNNFGLGGEGDACQFSVECKQGHYCKDRQCAPFTGKAYYGYLGQDEVIENSSCAADYMCGSGYCDPATNTCQPRHEGDVVPPADAVPPPDVVPPADAVPPADVVPPADAVLPPDADLDGVPDASDNCPSIANADQLNTDGDLIGDVCDDDKDGDGVANASDNCPLVANANQADADGDLIGNVCDADFNPNADTDGDGVTDGTDNCTTVANADQADANSNGIGDKCDMNSDSDGDNVTDFGDNCPAVANANQVDADLDGFGAVCDVDDNDPAVH